MVLDLAPETAMGMSAARARAAKRGRGRSFRESLARMWFYRYLYLLMLPGCSSSSSFAYLPMWGIIVAFQDFHLWQGLLGSPWVGFDNFSRFFDGPYFWRLLRNTLVISGLNIAIVFPAPIILALLLNEVPNQAFKRVIQTISYFPHFISWVVVGGLILYMFSVNFGFVTNLLAAVGLPPLKVLGSAPGLSPAARLQQHLEGHRLGRDHLPGGDRWHEPRTVRGRHRRRRQPLPARAPHHHSEHRSGDHHHAASCGWGRSSTSTSSRS